MALPIPALCSLLLAATATAAPPLDSAARPLRNALERSYAGHRGHEVLATLYPGFDPAVGTVGCDEDACATVSEVAIARWRHRAHTWAVVVTLQRHVRRTGHSQLQLDTRADVALVELRQRQPIALIAVARDAISQEVLSGPCGHDPTWLDQHTPGFELDPAGPELTRGAPGLGLRFTSHSSCNGWNAVCSTYRELALFRVRPPHLELVARLVVDDLVETAHPTDDDVPAPVRSRFTVALGRASHHALRDLSLRPTGRHSGRRYDTWVFDGRCYRYGATHDPDRR